MTRRQLEIDTAVAALAGDLRRLVEAILGDAIRQAVTEARQAANDVDGALRVSKAAEAIDVGEETLRRAIRRGELDTFPIAGITHVRISELHRWLDDLQDAARRRNAIRKAS